MFADIEWDQLLVTVINSEAEAWNNGLLVNILFLQHPEKPIAWSAVLIHIMEYSFALYSSQLKKKNPSQVRKIEIYIYSKAFCFYNCRNRIK